MTDCHLAAGSKDAGAGDWAAQMTLTQLSRVGWAVKAYKGKKPAAG